MRRIDQTVLRETGYIALWVLVLSAVTQAVFLVIGKWDYTVLLGNLLSAAVGIFNFLLMGITIQRALGKEEKEIKTAVRASAGLRLVFVFAFTVLGVVLPQFNTWTVLIPLLFPRVAVGVRPLLDKKKQKAGSPPAEGMVKSDADNGSVLSDSDERTDG